MRREVRKQPQLRAGQAHRPGAGGLGRCRHALVHLARIGDERAHLRAQLEHALGLGEDRARGARLAEREMRAGQLESDLDRQPGNAVVEQRPEPVRARQRRARRLRSPLVQRDACRHRVRDRARGVVAETGLLDQRLCGACAPTASPHAPCRMAISASCDSATYTLRRRRWPAPLGGGGEVVRRPIGRAEQRMGNAANEQRERNPPLSGANRSSARSASASARRRRPSCARAGSRPRARSWRCRPTAGSPRSRRRRARASVPPLPGRPRQARTPGSVDGECRVLHQLVIAEPAEPLLHGLHSAVGAERQDEGVEQAGDGVRFTRGVPIADRRLGKVVGDAPDHRPAVEHGHRSPARCARARCAAAARRGGGSDTTRPRRSSGTTNPFVRASICADRSVCSTASQRPPTHPGEHGRVREESRLGRRQPRQELLAEVAGDCQASRMSPSGSGPTPALDAPWAAVPAEVADLMRPGLPGVVEEIIAAVRAEVVEYDQPLEGEFGRLIREGATAALQQFVDLLGRDVDLPDDERLRGDRTRRVPRGAHARRAAVGVPRRRPRRVAGRRWSSPRRRWTRARWSSFAEAIFAYIDRLADASVAGYAREQSLLEGSAQTRRHALVELLLGGDGAATPPRSSVPPSRRAGRCRRSSRWWRSATATRCGWCIACRSARSVRPSRRAACSCVPDPDGPGRRRQLAVGPAPAARRARTDGAVGARARVGAACGHRLAAARGGPARRRHARARRRAPARPRADRRRRPSPRDFVAERLAPLQAMKPAARARATETLRAWLDAHGDVTRDRARAAHPPAVGALPARAPARRVRRRARRARSRDWRSPPRCALPTC